MAQEVAEYLVSLGPYSLDKSGPRRRSPFLEQTIHDLAGERLRRPLAAGVPILAGVGASSFAFEAVLLHSSYQNKFRTIRPPARRTNSNLPAPRS